MTGEQVIKALDICVNGFACKECPLEGDVECCEVLREKALEIIKSQKAEIENLESRIFALNDTKETLMESQEIYWKNKVKEFAERLKGRLAVNVRVSNEDYVDIATDIDDLVKEITGGDSA